MYQAIIERYSVFGPERPDRLARPPVVMRVTTRPPGSFAIINLSIAASK
jgi:hypothetical protein